jgi:hypothetical protein
MRADNTQHTVHFYYDDGISCGDPLCTPCAEQRVEGVFRSLGNRITAFPAQYDSESDTWEPYTDDCICGRWPYAAEVTYYTSYCPPTPRNELCPELREIVALLAGARVQVNDCDCDCGAGQWFRSLQKDLAIVTGAGRYVSPSKLDNPFGTRQGEQMAYDRLRALVGTNTVVVKHGRY